MTKHRSNSVDAFLSLLENPLLRAIIRFSGDNRLETGKTYLQAALDDLSGNGGNDNSLTRVAFSSLIRTVVYLGCIACNVDRAETVNALKVPYFKKGLLNVLGGIGRYGVTMPYRTLAPFLVVWNYTNACNLRCKHCYQRADSPTPDELATDERLSIVDQLDENNVSALALSGGEPLIRRDFFKIAEYASQKGLHVSVATNGTLLTKDVVERLKRSGIAYIEISLDGAEEKTHESFRGIEGCFSRTIQGIRNSVEAGIYTCVATTATRHNLSEVSKTIALAKRLGAKRVIVFNFIPTGRGQDIIRVDLSPMQRERLLENLYEELARGQIEVLCTAPQYSRVCLQQSLIERRNLLSPTHFAAIDLHGKAKQLANYLGGCGAGRLYCAIQPNGLVTPCVFMPIIVGDLRKQSLKEIWLNSKVMNELRDRNKLRGRCGHCEYKNICGGCRARAYAYHGDYLAPDPGCIRQLEEPTASFLIEDDEAEQFEAPAISLQKAK